MHLVGRNGERGPVLTLWFIVGVFLVLAAGVAAGAPARILAPAAAISVLVVMLQRRLTSWNALLALTIIVILFIPIRRYSMPGNLPFQLEPYRLAVASVAAAWVTSLLIDRRVRIRPTGLEGPLVAFAVCALGSVLANSSRIDALNVQSYVAKKLTFFLSFYLVVYIVMSVVRTQKQVDFLLRVLVGGGALVAAAAMFESWTHHDLFNDLHPILPFLRLTDPPQTELRGARLRVFASAQHPIALGAVLIMMLPLAVYLAKRTGHRRWWAACMLVLLGAFSTVSRTSVMMLLVIGLVFLWLRPETKRAWPLLLPMLLVAHVALPGALGTLQAAFFPKGGLIAEQKANAGKRGSGRIGDLGPAIGQFERQPLIGEGFGTRVTDEGIGNAQILDDQWLGTLLETGIAGVLSWIWLYVRFVRRLGRAAKEDDSDRSWLYTAIAASVAAYSVGMFTYDAWSFIQVTFVLFILLGLGSAALGPAQARRTSPALAYPAPAR
jgi:O-antigen ligase/polysaccharide polymerase Wzy-like membrane protein